MYNIHIQEKNMNFNIHSIYKGVKIDLLKGYIRVRTYLEN
jgi:hypothetical protein